MRNSGTYLSGLALSVVLLMTQPSFSTDAVTGNQRGEYTGSKSCRACHQDIYDSYIESNHYHYIQPATPETVIGDFVENNVIKVGKYQTRMSRRGNEFFVTTIGPDGKYHEYPCVRAIGFYFKQRYFTVLPEDGRSYVLPIQWNKNEKRWIDYHGPEKANPGDGEFWCDPIRAEAIQCAGCHDTGVKLAPLKPSGLPQYTAAEASIGCEACHGPCREHLKNPAEPSTRLRLRALPVQRQVDVCGQCHGRGEDPSQGTHYPLGFLPGGRLARSYDLVEPVFGKKTGDFWPDGSALSHHQQYTEFIGSAHYREGGMTCTTCHDPHHRKRYGMLKAEVQDNELCLPCHARFREKKQLIAHTHHDPDKEGSRCINCHMPKVISHEQPLQLRHHGFSKPNPLKTVVWGAPNACNLCHTDKEKDPPEKMAAAMEKWGIPLTTVGKESNF
jgi:predicted CXXCH cytochrome family protein